MRPGSRTALEGLGVLLFVTLVVHPTCSLVFQCGCRPLGFGGIAPCDIHDPALPDCPWCVMPWPGLVLLGLLLVGGTWLGGRRAHRFSWVGALLGYVTASLVGSGISAWASGYPRWLFFGS